MATYDLTSTTPTKLIAGDILNCPYSGAAKNITLPPGRYKLEVWGAEGGSYSTTYCGGKGGYSIGTISLPEGKTVFMYSGGQGAATTSSGSTTIRQNSSFNGGGAGIRASGGGGSDIRIGTDSLYARVIVAGGGGGSGYFSSSYYGTGGAGGGTSGLSGTYKGSANTTTAGQGGSQTSGGAAGTGTSNTGTAGTFGIGGQSHNLSSYFGGAGGGGWYGGGGASVGGGNGEGGGGGGSGYVYTSSTASNYPSGCLLNSAYYLADAAIYAGNTSFTGTNGSSETGHSGNGYCRITVIELYTSFAGFVNIDGSWKEIDSAYVNIGGTWKEIEGIHVNIGGSWKESG